MTFKVGDRVHGKVSGYCCKDAPYIGVVADITNRNRIYVKYDKKRSSSEIRDVGSTIYIEPDSSDTIEPITKLSEVLK